MASLVATIAMVVAAPLAWGHTFPPVRSVVLQVESCEVALLVGYRVGSGAASEQMLLKAGTMPKSHGNELLRELLTREAMGALEVTVDGKALVPTSVRAKLAMDAGQTTPSVVVLVTFALPPGKTLGVISKQPANTRISWTDRDSHRIALNGAPTPAKFYRGMASFLLSLTPNGGSACRVSPPRPASH